MNFGMYKRDKADMVQNLMAVPKSDNKINMPHTDPYIKPSYVHQADLLYLPEDDGYKYALVVVDLGSRLCDAEPMKGKTQAETLKCFQKIYSRKLKAPKALLQVDSGSEFKGVVTKWFNKQNIMVRYGKPDRHRQQAVVESYNGIIARALFYKMHQQEIARGETNREWVHLLPKLIHRLNVHIKKMNPARKRNMKKMDNDIKCEGDTCKIIPIGTKVRVISDHPTDSTGIRLHGQFRKTDLRWDPTPRTIEDIVLRPNQPITYKVSGIPNINYTKHQIQEIPASEAKPIQKKPATKKPAGLAGKLVD